MRYSREDLPGAAGFFHRKIFNFGRKFLPGPIGAGVDLFFPTDQGGGGARPGQGRKSVAADAAFFARTDDDIRKSFKACQGKAGWTCDRIRDQYNRRFGQSLAGCPDGSAPPCAVTTMTTTDDITSPAEFDMSGWQAVQGAFGMPAIAPRVRQARRFMCPPGMVLSRGNLCYPREVLRRNSRWRKWRPGMKPILSGGDRKAITKAKSAITAGREAISGLGLTVKKK